MKVTTAPASVPSTSWMAASTCNGSSDTRWGSDPRHRREERDHRTLPELAVAVRELLIHREPHLVGDGAQGGMRRASRFPGVGSGGAFGQVDDRCLARPLRAAAK
jgi:hypothetical protein